jgi:hypothetical protein
MSVQFFYENGQGKVVDECGVEPMELVVDEELFAIETISSHTQFLKNRPTDEVSIPLILPEGNKRISEDVCMGESDKRAYTHYTDQEKARFFQLKIGKCLSASAAAKQLGIHVRTAQRLKKYDDDPV